MELHPECILKIIGEKPLAMEELIEQKRQLIATTR